MDLFVVCCCLAIASLALDRAIALPPELEGSGRRWLRAIWLTIGVLWIVMGAQWVVVLWAAQ